MKTVVWIILLLAYFYMFGRMVNDVYIACLMFRAARRKERTALNPRTLPWWIFEDVAIFVIIPAVSYWCYFHEHYITSLLALLGLSCRGGWLALLFVSGVIFGFGESYIAAALPLVLIGVGLIGALVLRVETRRPTSNIFLRWGGAFREGSKDDP